MTETSLRDAKRAATARALAQAAFDLARERGVDGFTIDEVASRAGYSRRTFANHYSGKEEAIVAIASQQVHDAMSGIPHGDGPVLDWLEEVARTQLSGRLLDLLRQLRAMAQGHPSLRPHLLAVHHEIRETARQAILARVGDGHGRIHAQLLVGAAYGALTCMLEGLVPVLPPGSAALDPAAEQIPDLDDGDTDARPAPGPGPAPPALSHTHIQATP
ncbi:MAG: TetR/AcrR family transcriptional regulator, partial [Micrococcales bacterium]|nr:TetR/AcrR family transcriptional regulator [Micrococcales bacterium]